MWAQQYASCKPWLKQIKQSISCELRINNQAVSNELYQSTLSVYITSSLHVKENKSNKVIMKDIYSNYERHLRATVRFIII